VADWNDKNWIEKELARHLAPVPAPESLWGRVEAARRSARSSPQAGWILWPAVALMLMLASGDLLLEMGKARASMAPLTEQDLKALADGDACDFKSADPAQIERWLKAKTKMDVNLSCGRAGNAHLVGASLIRRHGAVVAAIAYQVGNAAATLLVSDRSSVFGWNRNYSIAWSGPKDDPAACNQCHFDARSQL